MLAVQLVLQGSSLGHWLSRCLYAIEWAGSDQHPYPVCLPQRSPVYASLLNCQIKAEKPKNKS